MDNTKYVTLTAEEVASDIDDLLGLAGHLSEIQHWAAQAGAKRLAVLAKKLLDATSAAAPKAEQPCSKCEGKGIVPIGDGYSVDGCPECVKQQAEPYTQADCGCTPSEACDICCGRPAPAQQQLSEEDILELAKKAGFFFHAAGYAPTLHTKPLEYSQKCFERFARALLNGGTE